MTLPLSKEMIEAAYNYLRTTMPFSRWKLPKGHQVKFAVSKSKSEFARYVWNGKQHTITLSMFSIGHTSTLMSSLAHEIIHLYLEENELESRSGGANTHNAEFKKRAKQVCKHHGFDPKAFY